MKIQFNKKAFSLIEIAIVIIIIAILIAGVLQSGKVIRKFRLNSARSVTISSPVNGIKNLSLWLESTSEKSFLSAETSDSSLISIWNDINPQVMTGLNSVQQDEDSKKPLYRDDAINGLPAIVFDGVDSTMFRSNVKGHEILKSNQVTIFVVQDLHSDVIAPTPAILCWNCSTNPNRLYIAYHIPFNQLNFAFSNSDDTSGEVTDSLDSSSFDRPRVITFLHNSNNYSEIRYNGALAASESSVTSTFDEGSVASLYIGSLGGSDKFKGSIGEIIMFARALKSEERISIEGYLKQKWGIK
jgi:prepilin-type N-terminal cleavage/methylation domain-containing protein